MSVIVITPATATALTTVANVRTDLGLAAGSPPDAQLQRFIDQASARAVSFCRRSFGRETVRERFVGCGLNLVDAGGGLFLDRAPVARIIGVIADGITLAPEAYETDGRYLHAIRAGYRTPWAFRNVVVDYEAGWFLPSESGTPPAGILPLPADIERAVIQLVGVSASIAGRDAMVKSESVEGVGSTDWYVQGASASLPHPEAESALSDYRRMMFA